MEKGKMTGSPEDLALIGKSPAKVTPDTFVNPRTPANPMVAMEDRKTGTISGKGTTKLRESLTTKG